MEKWCNFQDYLITLHRFKIFAILFNAAQGIGKGQTSRKTITNL